MKRIIFLLIVFLTGYTNAFASGLQDVSLVKCDDVDYVYVLGDDGKRKISFLGIESSNSSEVRQYVCDSFNNAKKIQVQYENDKNSAWFYLDGELFQEKLVALGYAEVVAGNYIYTVDLCGVQENAILYNNGIWANGTRKEKFCRDVRKHEEKKEVFEVTEVSHGFLYNMYYGNYSDAVNALFKDGSLASLIIVVLVVFFMIKHKKNKGRF